MKRDANIHPEWPTDSTDKTPAGTADSAKSPCFDRFASLAIAG
jgi:hypothetical protein